MSVNKYTRLVGIANGNLTDLCNLSLEYQNEI